MILTRAAMLGTLSPVITEEMEAAQRRLATEDAIYLFPRRLVRFFLPLPDPLPTTDRFVHVRTAQTAPWTVDDDEAAGKIVKIRSRRWIDALEVHSRLVGIQEDDGANVIRLQDDEPESPGGGFRTDHAKGYQKFMGVVRLWNGSFSDPSPLSSIAPVAEIIDRVVATISRVQSRDPLPTPAAMQVDYTVAEVIVPFFDMGSHPTLDPWERSLLFAVELVKDVQQAVYVVRKKLPLRLISRQTVQPLLNYWTGEVDPALRDTDDYPVSEWTHKIRQANMNLVLTQRPGPQFTSDDNRSLQSALDSILQNGPFMEYLKLRRRALVALDRDGSFEDSVIWSGVAAEFLLDEALRMISWETKVEPEKAAGYFKKTTITSRVKANYGALAGTQWDLKTSGAILDWFTNVARIRNMVVHGNSRVDPEAAESALSTIDALLSHIGDLLCANFDKFWRTAYFLVGDEGLERRGKRQEFDRKGQAVWEPLWQGTFGRWRETHTRLVEDLYEPRVPSRTVNTGLIFVWGRRNRGYWVHEDTVARQAIRVDVDESSLTAKHREDLRTLVDQPDLTSEGRANSMLFGGSSPLRFHSPWRECYQLLPAYGVMIDGSDIKDKEFTWRPADH